MVIGVNRSFLRVAPLFALLANCGTDRPSSALAVENRPGNITIRGDAAAGGGAIFSVKDYGAVGDGKNTDTRAIRDAINAANNAPGTNVVYFPAGTYVVHNIPISSPPLDAQPSDLIFAGEGARASILKRGVPSSGTQDTRIATVEKPINLTFQDLGFDANAVDRFGGVGVYGATNFTVQFVHCFDSNPTPPNGYDRYMFVLGGGTNLIIQDSHWEDLQMEVNRGQTVRIRRNLVERPRETGGIGSWGHNSGGVTRDYVVEDNWIVDPSKVGGGAIVFQVDNPEFDHNQWYDITVRNNTIVYSAPPVFTKRAPAIKFGVSANNGQPLNTVFDRILVEGNKVYVDPGVGDGFSSDLGLISFWATPGYFKFDNTTVINNIAYYDGTKGVVRARDYARGDNWMDSNNIKLPYQRPPAVAFSPPDAAGADASAGDSTPAVDVHGHLDAQADSAKATDRPPDTGDVDSGNREVRNGSPSGCSYRARDAGHSGAEDSQFVTLVLALVALALKLGAAKPPCSTTPSSC